MYASFNSQLSRALLVGSAVALVLAACEQIAGLDQDFVAAATASESAVGGAAAGGAAAGGAAAGGSGGAAGQLPTGGAGGTGGQAGAPCSGGAAGFAGDEQLLARYLINEADSGAAKGQLEDAAAEPLALALYGVTEELIYTEPSCGHRALRWAAPGLDARAAAPIDGTKLSSLNGATQATIELVVKIEAVVDAMQNGPSRLLHIGPDFQQDWLSLGVAQTETLDFFWHGGVNAGRWPLPTGPNPVVIHLVLSTSALSTLKLYVNATPQEPYNNVALPGQNEVLGIFGGANLVLGNLPDGKHSFQGELHYFAIYKAALSQADILHNVDRLLANDDLP